jgi:hypothetical protein
VGGYSALLVTQLGWNAWLAYRAALSGVLDRAAFAFEWSADWQRFWIIALAAHHDQATSSTSAVLRELSNHPATRPIRPASSDSLALDTKGSV